VKQKRDRLRIAIQKKGRISEKSIELLALCGLNFETAGQALYLKADNFPLDLMLVRDDDIPGYVFDGTCDLGIVGTNVLFEKALERGKTWNALSEQVMKLGFGYCRLALAVPKEAGVSGLEFLQGKRIATSYPKLLEDFLAKKQIKAEAVPIHGAVEITPALKIADLICDLVSSGGTLKSNGLVELATLLDCESVLIRTKTELSDEQTQAIARLLQRIVGVQKANQTKYIMMNAPLAALSTIQKILPGMEFPSVIPLQGDPSRVAIHAVAHENVFWETMENLKKAGASSILVLPIEKVIE
jgi:ATP phosphoribosyltransferase